MNADVQKPIQSLLSFRRHSSGGSIAALPPISFIAAIAIGVLTFSSLLVAEQPEDTNKQSTSEKRLDLLFNKIMQTMPDEARGRVDSASAVVREEPHQAMHQEQRSGTGQEHSAEEGERRLRTRLQELPDDLKAQVERTITEMQQRKEERKAQFRESRKNRP